MSDTERFAIMSKAYALFLPSFYEGFGMQILEAFALGIPVATSNISSLPEIAGDAALYFNPHDILSIKNALKILISNSDIGLKLSSKGQSRLKNFSWEKTAYETLEVFKKL